MCFFSGCPKVFFIQACRGKVPQVGVERQDDEPKEFEGPQEISDRLIKLTTPVDADTLVAYSQTDGKFLRIIIIVSM